jgi:mono/diheme cytochrome c family protein
MNRIRSLVLGLVLAAPLSTTLMLPSSEPAHGQMMERDGMRGMHEMMQRMMGAHLPPGLDPALLPDSNSEGARLLQHYCTQCHGLPGPGIHTAEEWPSVLRRMESRMAMHSRMMGGIEIPNAIEVEDLLSYLQTNAQRPFDPAHPDLDTPRGRIFRATCAQCHALPDPTQHTASEWPGVVARMQRNMAAMRRFRPDTEVMQTIIEFLQEHARSR